jgi:hypothetical protein
VTFSLAKKTLFLSKKRQKRPFFGFENHRKTLLLTVSSFEIFLKISRKKSTIFHFFRFIKIQNQRPTYQQGFSEKGSLLKTRFGVIFCHTFMVFFDVLEVKNGQK